MKSLVKYVTRRLLGTIPMIVLISIILFTLLQLAPGDPLAGKLDQHADANYIAKLKEDFGLDKPPVEQFFFWAKNFVQGNFGVSFDKKVLVQDLLSERIGKTVFLGVVALIFTYMIAIPLGILSANKPYSKLDYTLTSASFIGFSMPSFFAGLLLIYLFGFQLGWFPYSGSETEASGYEGLEYLMDRLHHVILPAMTLAIINIAQYNRYVRASVLDAKAQDYTRTARSKGLSESKVLRKHVLRNALIPLVTLFGIDLGLLLSGAIITETIFGFPGVGQLYIQSITTRDYPVVMAITMMTSMAVLIGNLIADILYAFVDPRIKYD
ncbi:ABC transporter permease [Baia soyae]|uniref:ABC transporter permease n=1 Tax=Baia soyae TaxID=1544746 RepID=UPI001FB53CF5|nr:ABC transporter permease [Baia soyae]